MTDYTKYNRDATNYSLTNTKPMYTLTGAKKLKEAFEPNDENDAAAASQEDHAAIHDESHHALDNIEDSISQPVRTDNKPYHHITTEWSPVVKAYVGSITIIGLYVMFKFLKPK